ncbi:galectin-4-like [Pelodytes ibericus]
MAFIAAPGYQPVYNPSIPFRHPIYGGLRAGMSVYIQGLVPHHVNKFAVNFSCGQYDGTDIAFHFNPRFDGKNRVVCNSFSGGSWGREEKKKDSFPFHKGQHFELVIFVNGANYQVNVNGSRFYEYIHRVPLERVQSVHVEGDVTIQSLSVVGGAAQMGGGVMPLPGYPAGNLPGVMPLPGYPAGNLPVMGGPTYNPQVPYFAQMPGGMTANRTVVVRGFIPLGAQRFHINLKVTTTNDIALHFNPRMGENSVVRNSQLRGSWGHEERSQPFNPFMPGQYFDISIRCGPARFKIFVNGQHFCDFAHRLPSFQMIDGLEIGGNVVLSLVQF